MKIDRSVVLYARLLTDRQTYNQTPDRNRTSVLGRGKGKGKGKGEFV